MNDLQRRLLADIDAGISRRQIARRAGVADGTIRNVLSGQQVSHATYKRIAENYLKIPVDEVLRMAGILPSIGPDGTPDRDWLLAKIYDVFSRLSDADKARMLAEGMRLLEEQERDET